MSDKIHAGLISVIAYSLCAIIAGVAVAAFEVVRNLLTAYGPYGIAGAMVAGGAVAFIIAFVLVGFFTAKDATLGGSSE